MKELMTELYLNKKMNALKISEVLKERGFPVPYANVAYFVRSHLKTPVGRLDKVKENFILSVTDLCRSMSTWVEDLREEYHQLQPEELSEELLKSTQVTNKDTKEIIRLKLRIRDAKMGEKDRLRYSLNSAYRNFVDLLKTPIMQSSVNVNQEIVNFVKQFSGVKIIEEPDADTIQPHPVS